MPTTPILSIRSATPDDLPVIMAIFDRAKQFMAQTGNAGQWSPQYPDKGGMLQDMADGNCYVCMGGGAIQGVFCYIPGAEPTYAKIYDGAWPDDAPYATIHRLASAGQMPGVAKACFDWCAAQGLPLRADTRDKNTVMQHNLAKADFVPCGTIYLQNGEPRLAYYRPQTPAEKLLGRVRALRQAGRERILVGIDGRSGGGKTTLAAQVQALTGCPVVHLDDFFLQPAQRTPQRLAEPGGNLDRERVLAEVLHPLKAGETAVYRKFICHDVMDFGETQVIRPAPLTLIEGSYACHPALVDCYDLTVFVDVTPGEQRRRILARNGDAAPMFFDRWIPMEENYFAQYAVQDRCDLVL